LQVSKPYGESAAYDFIVESGSVCSRIQVKSTRSRFENGFRCNSRASMSRRYKPNAFDFIAVHVILSMSGLSSQESWSISASC